MPRPIRIAFVWLLLLFRSNVVWAQAPQPCPSSIPYGNNAAAGHFASVNGIKIYYEIYGSGPALLLLHGNGGSISGMACHIPYFSTTHRVIAIDGRGRGKSEDGKDPLTFELQADDFAALLEYEHIQKTDVLGLSDGGIIALAMGIRHPEQIRKIIAAAPNLWPDDTALFPKVIEGMKAGIADAVAKLAAGDTSRDWARRKRQLEQDVYEPHISLEKVHSIEAPTLLVGADDDIVRPEHYLQIFNSLPHAHLLIIPGATHGRLGMSPLFHPAASQFLDEEFSRPTSK